MTKEVSNSKKMKTPLLGSGRWFKKKISRLIDEETALLQKEIKDLEKEVVFWKEKAMNFKRYHQ